MSDAGHTDASGGGPIGSLRLWAGLLVLLALALALGLRGLRARDAQLEAFPLTSGTLVVDAVERPVQIYRDPRGVPHVEAASERDAFAGLGFAHAQDRLGQMLWLRQRAQGRAAEVLGATALDADRMARSIGFDRLAAKQLPGLARDVRRALEAYTAGVNARIARIQSGAAAPPLAVLELGLSVEPWTPEDCLAVFKLHAWLLGASVEAVLVLDELIQALGPAEAIRFFPGGGLGEDLPVPDAVVQRPSPLGSAGALRRGLRLDGIQPGSSAWVLGGAHTESGWPIVAVDHHFPTSLPAWLHLDHVRGGELDVAGATLPGVPVFWSGRNQQVAWGAVAAGAVVTDLYKERLARERPGRYHDGRRWRDLARRVEKIVVRGAEPVTLEVGETGNGPLLPGREGEIPLAVSWTGARVGGPSGIGSLLAVARAGDSLELVEALKQHHEPVLAVVYADTDGAAGMQVAGWIPLRSLSAQLALLEGRAARYQWSDPVPFDALPSARLLDGEGWVVAADASLAPRARARIDWLWQRGARAQRIEALLDQAARGRPVDLRAMSQLQNDVVDAQVRSILDSIETLAAVGDGALGPQATELAGLLGDWDGSAAAESQGAAAYHVLLESLAEALFEQKLGESLWQRYLELPRTDRDGLLAELLEGAARDASSRRKQRAEYGASVARVVRESLREAWLKLSFRLGPNRDRWTWGRLHPVRFRPFGGLDVRLSDWALPPRPYPGTGNTLRAGPYDPVEPFSVTMASTVRLAFDTGSLDQSLAVVAPGQSEHRGHPHYDDQLEPWLSGKAGLLATGELLVEETSVARLTLEPVP